MLRCVVIELEFGSLYITNVYDGETCLKCHACIAGNSFANGICRSLVVIQFCGFHIYFQKSNLHIPAVKRLSIKQPPQKNTTGGLAGHLYCKISETVFRTIVSNSYHIGNIVLNIYSSAFYLQIYYIGRKLCVESIYYVQ